MNNEDETYTFENASIYKDNIYLLKALSLAFMCAKNPKARDTEREMVEVFLSPPEPPKEEEYTDEKELKRAKLYHAQKVEEYNEIIQSMQSEIGFHFHTAMKYEADAHQDCICALAKLIGHTDSSFQNYEFKKIIWKMVRFVPVGEENYSERGGLENEAQHISFENLSVKSG